MKRDWLEDKLIEKLSDDIQTDINLDIVWEDIETIRYPKKRRRFALWFIPLLALGLFLSFWISDRSSSMQNHKIINNQNTINKSLNERSRQNQDYSAIAKANKNETSTTIAFKSQKPYANTRSSQAKKPLNHGQSNNYPNETKQIENNETHHPILSNEDHKSENPYVNDGSSVVSKISSANKQLKVSNSTKSVKSTQSDQKRISIPIPLESKSHLLVTPFNVQLPLSANSAPMFNQHNNRQWTFGLRYSYGISSGSLSGTNPNILKRDKEKHLDAQSLELILSKPISNKFRMATGLELAQHIKVYKDAYTKMTREERDDVVIELIKKSNGAVDTIRGTSIVTVNETGQVTNYQRYRTVSIPIIIGYKIDLADKIQLHINAGFSLGYSLRNTGYSFQMENEAYTPITQLGYETKMYLSQKSSIGIQSQVSESAYFNFGFNTTIDLTNRNLLSDVNDKFKRYGMYLGIDKIF